MATCKWKGKYTVNQKRKLSVLLSFTVLASMIAGCSTQNASSSSAETSTDTTWAATSMNVSESAAQERVDLTFLCQINVDTEGYDVNDNPYINYLRERHNLNIEIISESANYSTKVSTMMASGDLPDYVQLPKAQ